jgi:DUF438 domain-containing protein
MINVQFDLNKINLLRETLLRLRHGESPESLQTDFDHAFKNVGDIDLLLLILTLLHRDDGIKVEDVKKLVSIHPHLYGTKNYHPSHPVHVFTCENSALQSTLDQIGHLLESFRENQRTDTLSELQYKIVRLGEFHKHYHRKEKLFFPMMERGGHFTSSRMIWGEDDQIRSLYKTLKRQIDLLPDSDLKRVQKTYDTFEKAFMEMVFQGEAILLPILESIFSEDDWVAIANESGAFGYALIDAPKHESNPVGKDAAKMDQNVRFGGGYLSVKEANLILNHLPLEITFIDKNSVFKYFNEITDAPDMMLVRTPISIGRNVANCHPPKSLKKVMTLIRDLKTKKRTSESMWFKKQDQYIHLTYKAIFNEAGDYVGVLEYVQDIQPFFGLPSEVKTGLSRLDG